ncbi:hypothetical protein OAN10_03905 [Alphaproteobacteria bacterium]|jgi:hypothetical protein|nr:hypothetical protein [Alphaproteobacteria bacterium]
MLQQSLNFSDIMTLDKMGARYPSRLSFSRSMLRRLLFDNWKISKSKFDLDDNGYGTVVYEITINQNIYSLVCFSQHLDNADRSDRVIAEKWDTAYSLINGKLDDKELDRLKKNVPLQESGRNSSKELILSRANKSVRLFEYVADCLSNGLQPNINEINKVGYLLRTTAVYGSGKFGLSDFTNTKEVTDFNQPFRAEMLSVYIIREFSVELVEHVAKKQNPNKAVKLEDKIKQHLGIGNSTGLGMAPFIIKHPKLINKWMNQYTESLNKIINKNIDSEKLSSYIQLLEKALLYLKEVTTFDEYQITKNTKTVEDLKIYINHIKNIENSTFNNLTWMDLIKFTTSNCNYDTQEIARVQLLELYPEISEKLAEDMSDVEEMKINESQTLKELNSLIKKNYQWALEIDFSKKNNDYLFWYISAAKLEPRLGERYNEEGSELEQHLGVAKMVQKLHSIIQKENFDLSVAEYLVLNPEFRGIIRRIQSLEQYPFAEVQDNILSKETIPINMLRFKLSFFGANRYDPKSDRWLRVSFFSGAPFLSNLNEQNVDSWGFATMSSYN